MSRFHPRGGQEFRSLEQDSLAISSLPLLSVKTRKFKATTVTLGDVYSERFLGKLGEILKFSGSFIDSTVVVRLLQLESPFRLEGGYAHGSVSSVNWG
ncbi:hypothetical protein O77CONTIG1_04237 [Leptolyngbya sp. O-77]|nr:hypothetical protein O77CONTIG1_04237 [Leptolyngbya sp. O-77]